ncbi:hypothetical protein BGX28_010260, partial [Mortierella sp. GBA30]
VILTVLGHIPGVIYAWWVIYHNREDPRTHQRIVRHRSEGGERRTYVAVASTPPPSGGNVVHYPQQGQVVQVIERGMEVSTGQGQEGQQGVQTGQVVTGQVVEGGQVLQGGKHVHVTKGEPQVQHSQQSYTTTRETASGPVRTTHTVHTTKYVVPVTTTTTTATIVDKKDMKDVNVGVTNVATPPPY